MTTQTIPPEAISASDWQQLFARSPSESEDHPLTHKVDASPVEWKFDVPESSTTVHARTPETPAVNEQSFAHSDSEEIKEIVGSVAIDVLKTDPDERLDYLQLVNPNLTEEHLGQIAHTTERWLDNQARHRIRISARRCYDNQVDPRDLLIEWDTAEDIPRLINLLLETSIPDKTLAMCYAMCAAYETAYAAFLIHENRAHRQTDFSNIEQTPEETAVDIRFVNAE